MSDISDDYQAVVEVTEPCRQRTLERFDVRVEKQEYKDHRSIIKRDREQYKLRYFVVDHEKHEVLYETEWDRPDDHRSDGMKSSAFGFRHGYKQALEEDDRKVTVEFDRVFAEDLAQILELEVSTADEIRSTEKKMTAAAELIREEIDNE